MTPRGLRVAALACVGLVALALPPATARGEGVEPPPRPVFFETPDPETAREIDELVTNHFKDLNKVVDARRLLVRRYGLVAVPRLVQAIEANVNEPEVLASVLAIASLRRENGPSLPLYRALPGLLRLLRYDEPWRRAFAALALGGFYGPEEVGFDRDPPSVPEEGPRDRARRLLAEARTRLADALRDEAPQVRIAAALALAKTGGTDAWTHVAARAREAVDPAVEPPNVEARMAILLALSMLPGSVEGRLDAALLDEDARIRAIGAFGIALRAVLAHGKQAIAPAPEEIVALDRKLQSTRIRASNVDGAEAAYARGSLALLGSTPRAWSDLHDLAVAPSTDPETALAAVQALLFSPGGHEVRARIASFTSREKAGTGLKEKVLAGFLAIAGSDGTREGVVACATFLRNRAALPRGSAEWDVRWHAAVGLCRALAAGRVVPEARAAAIDALAEAVRAGLVRGSDERSFQRVLDDVLQAHRQRLLDDPAARLPPEALARVEAAARDPDALLAREPVDVLLHRLDLVVRGVTGLDNLKKQINRTAPGGRDIEKDTVPLRYLLAWIDHGEPYFVRRDLRRDRGRPARPPAPSADDVARTVDR